MTPPDLMVLHTLRCIGFADFDRVAEAAGLAEPDVESELIDRRGRAAPPPAAGVGRRRLG